MAGTYAVQLVDRNGTLIYGPLVDCEVVSVGEVLDGVGQAVFRFPKVDPPGASGQAAQVSMLYPEVQILRNGSLFWWGVPLSAVADSHTGYVEVTCVDLGWYLTINAIDRPETNFLGNPSFEDATLDVWTDNGSGAVIATDKVELGTQSIRMTGGSAQADKFLGQNVSVTSTAIGTVYTLVAWVYVESLTATALAARGLYVEARDGSGAFKWASNVQLDNQIPTGQWVRLSTQIFVPPSVTWTLNVRLYACQGSVLWDACELVEMESLGAFNADMGDLARMLVHYIQDTANNGGKPDLNIAQGGATTGVVVPSRWWQFADHTMCDRALSEFVLATPGIDWSIELTSSTVRTFTVHSPHRGVDRTGSTVLTYTPGAVGNLASYRTSHDGSQTKKDTTVLGSTGSGPDRETGHSRDTSGSFGGLLPQEILNATPNAVPNALQPQADARLKVTKDLVVIPEVVVLPSAGAVGVVRAGDKVSLSISDGWVQVSGAQRVVAWTLDARTDLLTLTLNKPTF